MRLMFCVMLLITASHGVGQAETSKIEADKAIEMQPVKGSILANNLLEKQPYDIVLGDENAPVTMIEYFSLSCPHCADFQKNMFPQINENYIQSGKVKFIARSYAVDEPSLLGSRLLKCVATDKYYPFIKVLLSMQDKWAFAPKPKDNLLVIAKVGGVSEEQFEACFKDKSNEELVLQMRKSAEDKLKIDAIPMFFINGAEVRGAGKVEDIIKILDEQVAKAKE